MIASKPIEKKDEFGRIFFINTISYKNDTLSREFYNNDSALLFMDRAKKEIKKPTDGIGSSWVSNVWFKVDTIDTIGIKENRNIVMNENK
jgi:hypothetical protein